MPPPTPTLERILNHSILKRREKSILTAHCDIGIQTILYVLLASVEYLQLWSELFAGQTFQIQMKSKIKIVVSTPEEVLQVNVSTI